jgi:uncharacterized protein (DUF1501 family)
MKNNTRADDGGPGELARRDFLRLAGAGAFGLGLAERLAGTAFGAAAATGNAAPAKSLIQLALWGGMTQFETWDPKPNAAPEYKSAFKSIPTNVPGIEISELLPKMAQIADKYAILRAVMNPRTGHGDANYVMIANAPYPSDVISAHPTGKLVYPAVAAIIGMKMRESGRYDGEIPAWVCCGKPPSGIDESFLGPKYKAYTANPKGQAGLNEQQRQRLASRRDLLATIHPGSKTGGAASNEVASLRENVFEVMTSDAQKVFDLTDETDETKDRYGRTELGQACLLARRLAEYGVPAISVPWSGTRTEDGKQYGWDMHTELNASVRALCPILDQTLSALLTDLEERGILDRTIVVLFSENGKAPHFSNEDQGTGKPNGTKSGRNHWGRGFSVVIAGGGFKGGRTVGQMDDNGELLVSRPIYPWDLWESVYAQMGIDPHDTLPNTSGCVAYVSQADACGLSRGGRLTELL